ncbi:MULTISPECIES: hypothetical protein [unclassified Streptomyces]|uniref:hypothetical protein n=1 Tax=unclassified Streptomyces TaxID=2593676 RepID=UPI000DDA9674|nr:MULTISPECIES: hypothetical protein [unclassified Streptomyces]QZZ26521.1 hypothetical protein A7X85_09875 [Streptomyces sp. ST1015]
MRIKLASWYGDKAPGDVIDVDGTTAKALARDGLVAEVVEDAPPFPPAEVEEPETAAFKSPRRRR